MTPDTAARREDERDLLVLEAFELSADARDPSLAAAALLINWPESGFFDRFDVINVAAEITAIKSQIDSETAADAAA